MFFFLNVWDSGVPLFFINSLLTITIFPNIVIITIIYYYRETTCYNHCFFTVFLFVVRFSPVFCSVLRHLLVQAFRIVPSRPMPSPVQTSKSKLLYIQKDPLDGAASFIPLTVLQIKDLPRWWTRWTNGLYRGPTQEKNWNSNYITFMSTTSAVICNDIILLLCQHLQPSYVMTFDVIPLFLSIFWWPTNINVDTAFRKNN